MEDSVWETNNYKDAWKFGFKGLFILWFRRMTYVCPGMKDHRRRWRCRCQDTF